MSNVLSPVEIRRLTEMNAEALWHLRLSLIALADRLAPARRQAI